MRRFVSRHHGLLGTVIELHVWAASDRVAVAMEDAAITEMERLQRVFDTHDEASNLRRWYRGAEPSSPELDEVLGLAASWRERSAGAFDPAVGSLVQLWEAAAHAGRTPTDGAIAETLSAMRDPGDLRSRPSNLNAIAKGWIVDRCLDAAMAVGGAQGMTVNAGGDLLHRAPEALIVGVEDPARPYDNVAPLVRVALQDGAIATSGGARRGWQIGDEWYSHVIDPRSGRPVGGVSSASVLAGDAATADVVATILSVVSVEEGLAFVERLDTAGCLVVTRDGTLHRDPWWVIHELEP